MNEKKRIKERKVFNELSHVVNRINKGDTCCLCGKKVTSFCNSHEVPKYILKEIAENGKIYWGQNISDKEDVFNTKRGINNAFTFKLICHDCDNTVFKSYESKDFVFNFDSFDISMINRTLSSLAIKSHLASINTKQFVDTLKQYTSGIIGMTGQHLDVIEHFNYINRLKKSKNSKDICFNILFNKLYDYEMKIATQAVIAVVMDLEDNIIFNRFEFSKPDNADYIYLVVFPCEGKTRVLFYTEVLQKNPNSNLFHKQFLKFNNEDKLHLLFVTMMMYTERFFMSPSLRDIIVNDTKLVKLYRRTDADVRPDSVFKGLNRFKEYNNYFDKEYSKK